MDPATLLIVVLLIVLLAGGAFATHWIFILVAIVLVLWLASHFRGRVP